LTRMMMEPTGPPAADIAGAALLCWPHPVRAIP
jgi:hypothetical protein